MFTRTGRIATGVALARSRGERPAPPGRRRTPGRPEARPAGPAVARPGRSPSAWSPSRPASTSPRSTARRSRRRCSTTSTRPSSSTTRTARSSPAWPRRGRSPTTGRPTRSTWSPNAKFTNGDPFTADDAVFSIDRVQDRLDHLAQGGHGRRRDGQGRDADPAAGDAEQAQQRLAVPDDHADRRDVGPEGRRRPRHQAGRHRPVRRSTTWNRGDSITLNAQRRTTGAKQPATSRPSSSSTSRTRTALNNALLTGTIDVIGTVQAPESLAQFEGNRSTRSSRAPPTARSCCRSTTPRLR